MAHVLYLVERSLRIKLHQVAFQWLGSSGQNFLSEISLLGLLRLLSLLNGLAANLLLVLSLGGSGRGVGLGLLLVHVATQEEAEGHVGDKENELPPGHVEGETRDFLLQGKLEPLHTMKLGVDLEELNVKDKCAAGRDGLHVAVVAVAKLAGDDNLPLIALLHEQQDLAPSSNELGRLEDGGFATLQAGVEDLAVDKLALIVESAKLGEHWRLGSGSCGALNYAVHDTGFQGDHIAVLLRVVLQEGLAHQVVAGAGHSAQAQGRKRQQGSQ